MSQDIYDRQGRPMAQEDWALKFRDREYKRVAYTKVGVSGEQVSVSTVWLGLDHGWGDGAPLIFETLVMGGSLSDEMDRYSTEAEAIAGHEAMCERVRAS